MIHPQKQIILGFILIVGMIASATLVLYWINPYIAVGPLIVGIIIVYLNLKSGGITLKELFYGVEQPNSREVKE